MAMSLRNADDPPYGTVVPPTYVQIRGEFDNHGRDGRTWVLKCDHGEFRSGRDSA